MFFEPGVLSAMYNGVVNFYEIAIAYTIVHFILASCFLIIKQLLAYFEVKK
jgi:hypothetical protein